MRRLIAGSAAAIAIAAGAALVADGSRERARIAFEAEFDCKTARDKLAIFEAASGIYRTAHAQVLREQGHGDQLDADERWLHDLIATTRSTRDRTCPLAERPA